MPAWATVVLTLGTTVIGAAAALAASLIQLRHARHDREAAEEAAWRDRGAAVVGRVFGVLDDMEPQAIAASGGRRRTTIENIARRWWQTRDDLLVFASGHPSAAVAQLADGVVEAVSDAWERVVRLNRALEEHAAGVDAGVLPAAVESYRTAFERARRLREAIRLGADGANAAAGTGGGP
jgi:hypothetical protein